MDWPSEWMMPKRMPCVSVRVRGGVRVRLRG